MQTKIVPMNLGDIFDRLFKLVGKTALRNLIIGSIILVPATIIFTCGMNDFFLVISQNIRAAEFQNQFSDSYFFNLFKGLSFFAVTYAIFMLAFLTAMVGVTIVGCAEMSNQPIGWGEVLNQTFSIRLLRVYGQTILEYLVLGCLFIVPLFLIFAGAAERSIGMTLFGVMLCLTATVLAIYLWVRWAFALPAIAWENAGIIQSFGRSSLLVKDYWWRTFGIMLLLNIIAQFAISIVTTPIQFIALWGFFSKYFTMIGSISDGAMDSFEVLELFNSLGTGLGIVIFISYLFMVLVVPLITVVMYFDLRARKNEFSGAVEYTEEA